MKQLYKSHCTPLYKVAAVTILFFFGLVGLPDAAHAQEHVHGDVVNGDPITLPDPPESAPARAALQGDAPSGSAASAQPQQQQVASLQATLRSLNARLDLFAENCLFAFAGVAVSDTASGEGVGGLTESNFSIVEDGTPITDYAVQAAGAGGSAQADIVFVVDNSRSMGNDQAELQENLAAFVDTLQSSAIDYQLGLTRYGSSIVIENGGVLIEDPIAFRDEIFSRNKTSGLGGIERGYQAIVETTQGFNFRPAAQKVFIIVSDESLDQGGANEAETLAALGSLGATLFAVTSTGNSGLVAEAEGLAEPTGGDVFDLNANYNDILNAIAAQVANLYTISYRSPATFSGPAPRSIEITVNAEEASDVAVGSYVPGATPAGRRTAETAALRSVPADAALTLAIETKALVGPGVQEGTLFYRSTGDSTYASAPLSSGDGGVFEADVPASALMAPGVDYYFSFTDGHRAGTAPSADPAARPFQIGVGDNAAPQISLSAPPPSFNEGADVPVTAQITSGPGGSLAGASLFYREQGGFAYAMVPFAPTDAGDNYEAVIPDAPAPAQGLDYYAVVTSEEGVSTLTGTPDYPFVLGGCQETGGDTTPPVCGPINVERQGGELMAIQTSATDEESGIASVAFTTLQNLNGFLAGTGGYAEGDTESFSDEPETVEIRGERISFDKGGAILTTVTNGVGLTAHCDPVVEQIDAAVPRRFALHGNYPNPFSGQTAIKFSTAEARQVTVAVYDLLGRKVATLVNEEMGAGTYEVNWDASEVASGTYFYRIQAGSFMEDRKMVVIK